MGYKCGSIHKKRTFEQKLLFTDSNYLELLPEYFVCTQVQKFLVTADSHHAKTHQPIASMVDVKYLQDLNLTPAVFEPKTRNCSLDPG